MTYLRDKAQPIYDPFCGRGSIPLEAQRMGLKAVGSDLNPVAVLIAKALIELPPKFANCPPVNPEADPMGMTVGKGRKAQRVPWLGAYGLANDIRYYGRWMREEALKRIGRFYPNAKLSDGDEATVIAWLWALTVPCPNPACGVKMPLLKTFQLSTKPGNQYWAKPVVDRAAKAISFVVQTNSVGVPADGTAEGTSAICVACAGVVKAEYIRQQARVGNLGEQMTAVVAEGNRRRLFLSPTEEHIAAAAAATPEWKPAGRLPERPLGISIQGYGFAEWHQLFTERQLLTLTTLSDLLGKVRDFIIGHGADTDYADAVITYLALGIGKNADSGCRFARWQNSGHFVAGVFDMQTISLIWDFAENESILAIYTKLDGTN